MPFTPISITNGSTPINKTWGDNAQTQYTQASTSYEKNLLTPYVHDGLVASADGTILNQLDVTSGTAYIKQSDSTVQAVTKSSSTQTTSALSSTYHLYLQPDGTWYWSTSNSPAANSLAICDVTTDGSGNVLDVTDTRTLAPVFLPTAEAAGVPVRVAASLQQHVTTTAQTSIITYVAPTTALYRASATIRHNNATGAVSCGLTQWTEFDGTSPSPAYFIANIGDAFVSIHNKSGLANGTIACMPFMFWAQAGSVIGITYTDNAGTPNDYVTVILERLA